MLAKFAEKSTDVPMADRRMISMTSKPRPKSKRREYEFTLILTGIAELRPDILDALFEAGCDDATIALRAGRPVAAFSRAAGTLKDAILRAIRDIRKAGVGADVLRVDHCNLVTQAEIARKLGRSRQLVHQYMTAKRGPGGFPGPVCEVADGTYLWMWCEVSAWLWENGMIEKDVLRDAQEIEAINSVLELERQKKTNRRLTQEVIRSVAGAK